MSPSHRQPDNPTDTTHMTLQQALDKAQQLRRDGQWLQAFSLYEKLIAVMPASVATSVWAAVHHNASVCLLALGRSEEAAQFANAAFTRDSDLWQSGVIEINALKRAGKTSAYIERTLALYAGHPDRAEVVLAAANVTLNYLGDASAARHMITPALSHPTQGREARILHLMTRLYDRDPDDTPQAISSDICQLAQRDMQLDAESIRRASPALPSLPVKQAQRIGIVSPLLSASPVHAFCFSTLLAWHQAGYELVFIRRGRTEDWATAQFRSLAFAWIDAMDLEAPELHVLLRELNLDVLYEMGGWMDPVGLRAVSVKPAPEMYKWVGGQSCTTGLSVFDGFITDFAQSPPETAQLYSERLLLQDHGYVQYTPPPYMLPYRNRAGTQKGRWGVISNPVKLSRAFLSWLVAVATEDECRIQPHDRDGKAQIDLLVLADHRYANPRVRQRIEAVLRPAWGERLIFEVPQGHVGFIETLVGLEGLIDTFPYSCGLTMVEGLYVGLSVCFPDQPRLLFCERHGWAHVVNHSRRLDGA